MSRFLFPVFLVAYLLTAFLAVEAQAKPPVELQEGDIELESTQTKRKSLESRGRQEAAAWLQSLRMSVEGKGDGSLTELGDPGISYLAAFYFFCSVKLGDCAFVLNSLLEGDVITSRATSEVSCSIMNRFWKRWLAGDFDARAKYRVSAASGAKLAAFNASDRPRYIKCRETVRAIVDASADKKERYAQDGEVQTSIARTQSLLDEIWGKNLDIFDGVEPESSE